MLMQFSLLLAIAIGSQQAASPATDSAAIARIQELRGAGKLTEAREAAERLLATNPGLASAQTEEVLASDKIALDELAKNDADAALIDLLRARKFAPENPKLLFDLGVLEDEMKLYHDADETLARLEQMRPNDPNALYAAARVKLDLGQLPQAEEKMRAYLKLKPEDASAHYGLGRVYRQGLKLDQAKAEFKRCIELQPKQTEGYYELGDTELQSGEYSDAQANFNKTLERNPSHGGALVGIGIIYFKQKQYDKAIFALEKAVTAAPDYQPGHYYLGLSLARLGRQDESKRELEIATAMAEKESKQSANHLRLNEQAP
jgi:tetratricopeptide (TPR) repeat protein